MSVMDELKNVVTTGRELLATVSGKMKEIDKKVDEATASVPSKIRSLSEQKFFIDAVNGDDANIGNQSKPFKTTKPLESMLIPSFSTSVYFRKGQTHDISGGGFNVTGYVRFANYGTGERPVLNMLNDKYFDDDGSLGGSLVRGNSATIRFQEVNLRNVYEKPNGRPLRYSSGIVGLGNGSNILILDGCDIELKNAPFCLSYSGYATSSHVMRSVNITKLEDSDGKGRYISTTGGTTSRVDANDFTVSANTSLKEQLSINNKGTNILTNIDISAEIS